MTESSESTKEQNRSPGLDNRERLQWDILTSLGIIAQLMGERRRQLLTDVLPPPLFAVINHLMRRGEGQTVTEVARALQVPQPGMTKSVQKLMDRGLLRMEPDAGDARRKHLFVTAAGRKEREETLMRLGPDAALAFADWTDAEMAELQAPLYRLRRWLDENRGNFGQ